MGAQEETACSLLYESITQQNIKVVKMSIQQIETLLNLALEKLNEIKKDDTNINEIETFNLEELEKKAIIKALKLNSNKEIVAKKLGISISCLYRKIAKFNIETKISKPNYYKEMIAKIEADTDLNKK